MLTVYIDESGTHEGSKVLILAAYIGFGKTWKRVEQRFKKSDLHAGVPFHAVDCATGGKDYRGMDADKRNRITKKMVKIVNDHDIFGFACGAWIEDYGFVFPRNGAHWETWLSKAFGLSFALLMIAICTHMENEYPYEQTFSLVMEDSEHWYPLAAKNFLAMKHDQSWSHREKLGAIAALSPQDAIPLNAPDLLAYETYLLKTKERYPTKHGLRKSMQALLTKRLDGKMWDEHGFSTLRRFEKTKKFDPKFPEYPGVEVWKSTLKQ
jgi:hypothetical protein